MQIRWYQVLTLSRRSRSSRRALSVISWVLMAFAAEWAAIATWWTGWYRKGKGKSGKKNEERGGTSVPRPARVGIGGSWLLALAMFLYVSARRMSLLLASSTLPHEIDTAHTHRPSDCQFTSPLPLPPSPPPTSSSPHSPHSTTTSILPRTAHRSRKKQR